MVIEFFVQSLVLVFSFLGPRSLLYCRFCGLIWFKLRDFGFLGVVAFLFFAPCIHPVYLVLLFSFGTFLIQFAYLSKNKLCNSQW